MSRLKTVKVVANVPATVGTGRLVVEGWSGPAQGLQIAIEASQGLGYLQEDQQWRSNEFWFDCPFEQDAQTGELSVGVGAFIVNALMLQGSNVRFKLWLRSRDHAAQKSVGVLQPEGVMADTAKGQGVQLEWVTCLTSRNEGVVETSKPQEPAEPQVMTPEAQVSAVEITEPKLQEPEVKPQPVVDPKPQGGSNKWLMIGGVALLVLLLLGGAAWWWMNQPEKAEEAAVQPAPAAAQPAAPAAAAPAAVPCSAQAMQEMGELVFVQACVAQSPSSQELLQTIAQAKEGNHCGIAQRLYANRGQGGDVQIAEAYAKEYDPQFHQASSCFAAPVPETAAYWWETILGFQADHALAAQRLKELKP